MDNTLKELNDILPQYKKYVDIKRRYQLGELSEATVENSIKLLVQEIKDFMMILYRNTDMPVERKHIISLVSDLTNIVV